MGAASRVGLAYIRARYRVPARRGARVELRGKFGVITGSNGDHVQVKFDGEPRSVTAHPAELNYVEAGEAADG